MREVFPAVDTKRMDSSSIQFILEWAIAPIAVVVIWMIRKLLLIDSSVEVLKAEVATRAAHHAKEHKETLDTISAHNSNVMTRLTSIEEHLRNGKKG